jgi:hypothetical protein
MSPPVSQLSSAPTPTSISALCALFLAWEWVGMYGQLLSGRTATDTRPTTCAPRCVAGCSARHVCLYRGACEVSVLDCLCEVSVDGVPLRKS